MKGVMNMHRAGDNDRRRCGGIRLFVTVSVSGVAEDIVESDR